MKHSMQGIVKIRILLYLRNLGIVTHISNVFTQQHYTRKLKLFIQIIRNLEADSDYNINTIWYHIFLLKIRNNISKKSQPRVKVQQPLSRRPRPPNGGKLLYVIIFVIEKQLSNTAARLNVRSHNIWCSCGQRCNQTDG